MTKQRLQCILHVKSRIRDVKKSELASAEEAVARAADAADQAERVKGSAIETLTEPCVISAEDLAHRATMVALAARSASQAQGALEERKAEREERAETVFDAVKDVRALESLHRRMDVVERRQAKAREQGETDEAAARIGAATR